MIHKVIIGVIGLITVLFGFSIIASDQKAQEKAAWLPLLLIGAFCFSVLLNRAAVADADGRDKTGTVTKKEYTKDGRFEITVREVCKHGYKTTVRYNIQKEDYMQIEIGDEFSFDEYQKKFALVADKILWLAPVENRPKSESLIRTVGEHANSGNTVIRLLMNDHVTEAAMFYCSVLALSGDSHPNSDAIDAEINAEFGWKPFTKLQGTDSDTYTIETEDFSVRVAPSSVRGCSRLITVVPLKEGIDILKFSSPGCDYTKSIALVSERVE